MPFAQAAPSDPAPAFASSFETGQRPLDWTSTVEVVRDGAPKASEVTGPATTGIPGDITSQVSGVTASSDNPPGETAAKASDSDVNSKWVDFHATGWINVTFPKAATVKRYALVSANDGRSGTRGAWQLYDSNDGITGPPWTRRRDRTSTSASRRGPATSQHHGIHRLSAQHHRAARGRPAPALVGQTP